MAVQFKQEAERGSFRLYDDETNASSPWFVYRDLGIWKHKGQTYMGVTDYYAGDLKPGVVYKVTEA